jgi:hypothetical protein
METILIWLSFIQSLVAHCRQLKGEAVGLAELRELDPPLAVGLEALLAYDGADIADVFAWHFCIEFDGIYEHVFRKLTSDVASHVLPTLSPFNAP